MINVYLCCNRVSSLDSLRSSFNSDTQTQIFSNIQQLLTSITCMSSCSKCKFQNLNTQCFDCFVAVLCSAGLNGLGCYGGGSFYAFIKSSFLSFGFPDLSAFLSLIPADRQQEVLMSRYQLEVQLMSRQIGRAHV